MNNTSRTAVDARSWKSTAAGSKSRVIRGVCVFLLFTTIAGLLLARYTGVWRNTVDVVASMSTLGDGLPQNADVKFRGVLVGTVARVDSDE